MLTVITTLMVCASHAKPDTFCSNTFASLTQLVALGTVEKIVLNARKTTRCSMENATV